jgi:hypothetical protein
MLVYIQHPKKTLAVFGNLDNPMDGRVNNMTVCLIRVCSKLLAQCLEPSTLVDILVYDTIARWGVFNRAGEV